MTRALICPDRLPAAVRRGEIRALLAENQAVSISDLAARFGVSEMTIRRDLDALEQSGQVQRTHGGAVLTERLIFEFDFRERQQAQREAKRAIARRAAELVEPGMRVLLDTGTTTLELAALLTAMDRLTVITPSLAVVSLLQFSPGVDVILLGGVIRRGSPDLTGAITEYCLDLFAADVCFQGADAIGPDGSIYNSDLRLASVDRKMRSRSARTFILADSTKFGRTALARSGALTEVEALITDAGLAAAQRRALETLGVTVLVAPSEQTAGEGTPPPRGERVR